MRAAVRKNAGGNVNHSMLWRAMAPSGGGKPAGALAEAITRDFGSFEKFKTRFNEAGEKHFASGWVWLGKTGDDKLEVTTTDGHENPLTQGQVPLSLNDGWQHAHYLQH